MGDRHGGRFARRGRALNPPHPQVDAPHGESLPTRRTSERICPHARTLSSAKASRHGARAKEFAPRRNALLGEGFPTRRTSEKICPARERSPRRKPPDTAHGRRDLPRAGTRPSAKASRHGARAKGFVPRRNTPLGEGIPTRRTSEKICPHENALLGEGLPTQRTSERICPAQKHAPRRKPPDTAHGRKDLPAREGSPPRKHPDTAHERKNLPRAGTRPAAKASRHGTKAKRFAPRRNAPHGESLPTRRTSEGICPTGFAFVPRADERRAAHDRRTAEKHPFGGVAPTARGRCRIHSPKKNKTTP